MAGIRPSASTMSAWKSTRGAETASTGDMPWSTTLRMVWRTAVTILVPPGAPTTARIRSAAKTIVGVIIVIRVLPGAIELTRPGRGSKQLR